METNNEIELLNILSNNYYNSAWKGHFEFATWLTKKIKPDVIVELGVDYAHSTFSFAGAKIGHIYGIDSFEGDVHAGIKNTFDIVTCFNEKLISEKLINNNITFIKGYFNEVVKTFDKQIDILHIDGLHTYAAVKDDYESWVNKTHSNSIVLFHDVTSYPESVGKLFSEIQTPKFYFSHSAGLGVLCSNEQLLTDILTDVTIPHKEHIVNLMHYDNKYKIEYGTKDIRKDITNLVLYTCIEHDTIIIPKNDDARATLFGDPLPGVVKSIYIHDINNNHTMDYDHTITVKLNINNVYKNSATQTVCFLHSCNLPNKGTKRLEYLVKNIKLSGIECILDKIYVNNIGIPIDNTFGDKYEICNYSDDPKLYEIPTINKMKDFANDNPNTHVLYLHTKGVSFDDNYTQENDWIDMMLHFLVTKYKNCIYKLNTGYNTIGCNYSGEINKTIFQHLMPYPLLHYSGNFWWANTNYLKTLPYLSESIIVKNDAEFWLHTNSPTYYNCHNSDINHYALTYPITKYIFDNSNAPIDTVINTTINTTIVSLHPTEPYEAGPDEILSMYLSDDGEDD